MALFSTSHFLAVCLSLVFVIKHFGNYFRFLIRRWWCCRTFAPQSKELYVFWGLNQGSVLLANNILQTKDNASKTSRRVVLIHTTDETETQNERMGIARLFNMITLKNEKLQQFQENGGIVFNSFNRLSSLNISNIKNSSKDGKCDILQETLGLQSLVRLINKKTEGKVHFFILSDDTKANANAVINLLQDRNIEKVPVSTTIHCLANHEETELLRNTIQATPGSKVTIDIIDRASLAMLQLKRGKVAPGESHPQQYGLDHPIQYIQIDTEHACALESFDALIIGFGETGKEALSFIYEYSALPNAQGDKNETHITVIDSEMQRKEGLFYEQHPAFRDDTSEIELLQADINSKDFTEQVSLKIRDLDYVIISLGNDDHNLDVAIRLFNLAYRDRNIHRYGKEKPELGIYLRCNSMDNFERMSTIVDKLNDSVRTNGKPGVIQLHVFGSPQSIFTHFLIVENTPLVEAMEYHWQYNGCKAVDKESLWKGSFESPLSEPGKDKNRKDVQQSIYRKVQQNISNSLHIDTKLQLLGLTRKDKKQLKALLDIVDLRENDTIDYKNPEWQQRLLRLAVCEHLRWEASLKMMGYIKKTPFTDGSADDQKKTHECLIPWNDIPKKEEKTKAYDCTVVDTSIRIAFTTKTEII